jgi:hypothetical protein
VTVAYNYSSTSKRSVDEFAKEGVRLSKEFVHHLYGHSFDWCMNRVTKDFIWIGSEKDYHTTGRDEFSTFLAESASGIPQAAVSNEEYNVISCTERICIVAGTYLVLTPPGEDMIYAQCNRCTFIWLRSGRRILLSHLHLSTPVDYAEQGDGYAISAGTETYKYMRSLIKLGSSRKSLSLYDVNGTVHWVHPSQVIYLEASRKHTIVHCMTKDIVVPAVIRDTIEMVGDKVIRVHRSYAVNRNHVVELKAGMLLLDDGTSIAIPAKRIADVRAALTGR